MLEPSPIPNSNEHLSDPTVVQPLSDTPKLREAAASVGPPSRIGKYEIVGELGDGGTLSNRSRWKMASPVSSSPWPRSTTVTCTSTTSAQIGRSRKSVRAPSFNR